MNNNPKSMDASDFQFEVVRMGRYLPSSFLSPHCPITLSPRALENTL